MTKLRSSAYKPHCCLCPSPDDLPKAALQLFHRDLLYVLTNSANMAPLSICRFLAQDLPSLFQSSPHRYSDRTLQLPEDILIVLPSAFALVYLKGFPPLHLSTPMLQDQLKYHFLKEVFPEAPIPTPCLRYMHSHLWFPNFIITAPKKHTSIFLLISLPSESVNSLKISNIFFMSETSGIVLSTRGP